MFGYFVTLKGKDLSISLSPFIKSKPKDISLEAFNGHGSFVLNSVFSGLDWGLTKKSTGAWTFSHRVLGARDVSYPASFGTHNIKLNFIQKLFGDSCAPISAFYGRRL